MQQGIRVILYYNHFCVKENLYRACSLVNCAQPMDKLKLVQILNQIQVILRLVESLSVLFLFVRYLNYLLELNQSSLVVLKSPISVQKITDILYICELNLTMCQLMVITVGQIWKNICFIWMDATTQFKILVSIQYYKYLNVFEYLLALASSLFSKLTFLNVSFQQMASSAVACFMMVFVVEYLATQTGGATVNNIFEVRFTDTKID